MKKTGRKIFSCILSLALLLSAVTLLPASNTAIEAGAAVDPTGVGRNIMVGYYHVFKNGAGNGLQLRDIDECWDVVELSFGEPSGGSANIGFSPMTDGLYPNTSSFKSDVEFVQARGQKVCLSIGGQNGQVSLNSAADANTFISSVSNIIDTYDLDGLDIDFEGHSLSLVSGDTSLKNPTSPTVVYLIQALRSLCARYGDSFILTMAPETLLCHNGCAFYGGSGDSRNGVYLPVIDAMRNDLSWLQAQLYNTANGYSPYVASPTSVFSSGSSWYNVVMMDMLLEGFYIGEIYVPANKGDPDKYFAGLDPDQMVMGVPSGSGSAGAGTLSVSQYIEAMEYMMYGGTINGYTVMNPSLDFRGIMTWSINWDVYQGKTFSTGISNFLDEASGAISLTVNSGAGENISAGTTASFTATASGSDLAGIKYTFSVVKDGSVYYTAPASTSNTFSYRFTQPGTYSVRVAAATASNSTTAQTDDFSVTVTACAINAISVSPAKASVGSPITWTVDAVGTGNVKYKFDVYLGSNKVSSGTAQNGNFYSYTPAQSGEYRVEVTVSDDYSAATRKGGIIWVSSVTNLEITSVQKNISGGSATFTVYASGGSDSYTYCYYFLKDGSVYKPAAPFTSSNTVTFTPETSGTYQFRVYVRDTAGNQVVHYENVTL